MDPPLISPSGHQARSGCHCSTMSEISETDSETRSGEDTVELPPPTDAGSFFIRHDPHPVA